MINVPIDIATAILFGSLIISIIVLIYTVIQDKKEREYTHFIDILKYYDSLKNKRIENWGKLKDIVSANPKIKDEIPDGQDTLSYLKIRAGQKEPMYSIEHGILENEIRSLNLLNELCRMAKNDKRMMTLLTLMQASEISYYNNKLNDLLKLFEDETQVRLFSKPKYDILENFNINDYYHSRAE